MLICHPERSEGSWFDTNKLIGWVFFKDSSASLRMTKRATAHLRGILFEYFANEKSGLSSPLFVRNLWVVLFVGASIARPFLICHPERSEGSWCDMNQLNWCELFEDSSASLRMTKRATAHLRGILFEYSTNEKSGLSSPLFVRNLWVVLFVGASSARPFLEFYC